VLMSRNINFAKQQATITIYQQTHITTYMSMAYLQVAYVLQAQIGFRNLVGFVHVRPNPPPLSVGGPSCGLGVTFLFSVGLRCG
jgi:hypothetical protein